MSTGSTPQSSPRLPGLSAEEARQIPYTIVQTLSILDFLRIHLIRFGVGTVLLGTVSPGSKRLFGIDSTFHFKLILYSIDTVRSSDTFLPNSMKLCKKKTRCIDCFINQSGNGN